jgi:hypothetical protein
MTDTPNTNPDANTIMVLSITTASGPRSIITNTLPLRDANLIAATLQAAGHYAEVRPMGAVYSLAEHMQKHRAGRRKLRCRTARSRNCTPSERWATNDPPSSNGRTAHFDCANRRSNR